LKDWINYGIYLKIYFGILGLGSAELALALTLLTLLTFLTLSAGFFGLKSNALFSRITVRLVVMSALKFYKTSTVIVMQST